MYIKTQTKTQIKDAKNVFTDLFKVLLILFILFSIFASQPTAGEIENINQAQAETITASKINFKNPDKDLSFNSLAVEKYKYHTNKNKQIQKIEKYMQKYTPKSPITAELLWQQSKLHNFPVSFLLAVGHSESHLGSAGRGAKTYNPYNVGNTDAGDYKPVVCGQANRCLDNWKHGINQFISLIKRCYFHDNEVVSLQTWISRDFRAVRCNIAGKRYMSNPQASTKYRNRISNLKAFGIDF